MADYTAYFNGEWVPFSQVKIDPLDRGFQVADVVFDVPRTFNGEIFRAETYLNRFYRSLKYLRIDPGLSREQMLEIWEEAVRLNEPLRADAGDFLVQAFVTRGPGRWSHSAGPPTVCVRVAPLDFGRYARYYKDGAHGVIARTRSYPPESMEAKVKHFSRINFALAELEVADVDPEAWPILLDTNGNLTEGTINSVLLVTDGVIRTSGDQNILQSVSRGTVFDLAAQLNIPVVEEDLQPYDLYTADEVFLAFTGACALPVTKVDNRQVGDGNPGPIVQQLLAAWSESVGLDIVDQALRFTRG